MGSARKPNRLDVAWNVAALAVFAGGALVANVLIARFYGPAVTGVFNQTLALYIIASQLAVFGIHLAALREASFVGPGEASQLTSDMLLALVWPVLLTTVAGFVFSFAIPWLFRAEGLDTSWRLALLGLPSFALSKVLINIASGLGYYRVYGSAQAARSLLFLGFSLAWIRLDLDGRSIAIAIAASELVVAAGLLIFVSREFGFRPVAAPKGRRSAIRRFGLRVMPSVAVADINTRIDVLVLGIFASAEQVGIYSIAAWIIEGALQLPVALRPMINAPMAKLLQARDFPALRELVRRVGGTAMAVMAVCLGSVCLLFPSASAMLLRDPKFDMALGPLLILSIGAVANSWASPFDMMLVQAARLRAQLTLKAATMGVNLMLAVPLTLAFGATGAAAAYAASLFSYGLLLRSLVRRSIGPAI